MRDAPDISAATKIRIRQLAEQLGYTPDSQAQGLRNRKTRLFGAAQNETGKAAAEQARVQGKRGTKHTHGHFLRCF